MLFSAMEKIEEGTGNFLTRKFIIERKFYVTKNLLLEINFLTVRE